MRKTLEREGKEMTQSLKVPCISQRRRVIPRERHTGKGFY